MSDGSQKESITIALFGATGRTGREFLRLALHKGYLVKALVRDPNKLEETLPKNVDRSRLQAVKGTLQDIDEIETVLLDATHVVCMMAVSGDDSSYPRGFMTNFIMSIHPILERTRPKLLVYQAGSMSVDGNGNVHPLSFVVKHTYGRKHRILLKISDNDDAIQCIQTHQKQSSHPYNFLVTRAGVLVAGPPTAKAMASLSWPPLPYWNTMTFVDLAEFTVNALQDESLYNTCPYIR